MIGEPYNANDIELLNTLINNLVIALKNARSFEEIRQLNKNLQLKNVELEIDYIRDIDIELPDTKPFNEVNLTKSGSDDIKEVEKDRKATEENK